MYYRAQLYLRDGKIRFSNQLDIGVKEERKLYDSRGEKMFQAKKNSGLDMWLKSQNTQIESTEVSLIRGENETVEINEITLELIKSQKIFGNANSQKAG